MTLLFLLNIEGFLVREQTLLPLSPSILVYAQGI